MTKLKTYLTHLKERTWVSKLSLILGVSLAICTWPLTMIIFALCLMAYLMLFGVSAPAMLILTIQASLLIVPAFFMLQSLLSGVENFVDSPIKLTATAATLFGAVCSLYQAILTAIVFSPLAAMFGMFVGFGVYVVKAVVKAVEETRGIEMKNPSAEYPEIAYVRPARPGVADARSGVPHMRPMPQY